ncbi:hypothetical protein LLY42_21085 [Pseudomonas frederiksbergensis]|nr:hypothetical protein LLY42_21085 [Pseudomonas frederiksbergensis]
MEAANLAELTCRIWPGQLPLFPGVRLSYRISQPNPAAPHTSLLPRHQGRDAVHWAVHKREPVTGDSVYLVGDGADTVPVLPQDWCHVRSDDMPQVLWSRVLVPVGLRLFSQVLAILDAGVDCEGHRQDPALAIWEPRVSSKRLSG